VERHLHEERGGFKHSRNFRLYKTLFAVPTLVPIGIDGATIKKLVLQQSFNPDAYIHLSRCR
jgi:hypothetical protein